MIKVLSRLKRPDASDLIYTSRISYRSGDLYAPSIPGTESLSFEFKEFYEAIFNKKTRDFYNNITLQTMRTLEAAVDSAKKQKIDKSKKAA